MDSAKSVDQKVIACGNSTSTRTEDDHQLLVHDDHGKAGVVEDELETKIEKFFSLIRSYREARNRLMILSRSKEVHDDHDQDDDDDGEIFFEVEKRKAVKRVKVMAMAGEVESRGGGGGGGVWVPSFERGDFTEDVEFRAPAAAPSMLVRALNPCSSNNKASTTTKDHNGLDLNLTL